MKPMAQGDVCIFFPEIYPSAQSSFVSNIIVGTGEKPNHNHVLLVNAEDEKIEIMLDHINAEAQRVLVARIPPSGATLVHPEHGPQAIAGGAVAEIRHGQVEFDPNLRAIPYID